MMWVSIYGALWAKIPATVWAPVSFTEAKMNFHIDAFFLATCAEVPLNSWTLDVYWGNALNAGVLCMSFWGNRLREINF